MTTYQVESTDTSEFMLTQDGHYIGALKYSSWFSFRASINILNDVTLHSEPRGFSGANIEIKQDGKVLLDFKMNWKGHILIHAQFDGNDQFYTLKQNGFFRNTFILKDSEHNELLTLEPDFKWGQNNYDYELTSTDAFEANDQKNVLMLIAIHGANYFITMMTSTAAVG